MAQELLEYLDGRFDELRRENDAFRQETRRGFADLREQIDATNERIDATNEGLGERIDATNQRLDRVEEDGHQTQVMVEDLRSRIETVAEGLVGLREGQDKLREEMKEDTRETRQLIGGAFTQLDRRVSVLEEKSATG